MNPNVELSLRLRDLHLPPEPSWWPPALGWWVLLALFIVAMHAALRWGWPRVRQWWRMRQLRRQLALICQRLDDRDSHAMLVAEMSMLLRRAVIESTSDPRIAGWHGLTWVSELQRVSPRARALETHPELVTSLPYASAVDGAEVKALAELVDVVLSDLARRRPC